MNKWKILFLTVLSIVDAAILAITVGYLVMAIKTPNSLAGRNVLFTGSYILFICYLLVFAILTTALVICYVKWKKKFKK